MWANEYQENQEVDLMPAPLTNGVEAVDVLEPSLEPSCRDIAAHALTIVRDGVITGEGPTTKGRVHFSRALDADDAAWCARILTAAAVEHQPVSRAEVPATWRDCPKGDSSIGREPTKRAIGDSVVNGFDTFVGRPVHEVRPWPAPQSSHLISCCDGRQ
jgi:hypothetical protein